MVKKIKLMHQLCCLFLSLKSDFYAYIDRTGKDRKDIDKDWTLCNVFTIFYTIRGISKMKKALYFLCSSH